MTKRIALFAALVLCAAVLPGCPGAGSGLVGTWIITIGIADIGLILEPNGVATSFVLDNGLSGTFTLRVEGDYFFLDQMGGSDARVIYAATIATDQVSMTGARVVYAGTNTGIASTWTAAKQ